MTCAICHVRKPKRYCPGVHGDICSVCCGQEREVTVDCPFDCPYLQEARKHERPLPIDPKGLPNPDIRITEEFLEDRQMLLFGSARALLQAALETGGAVDSDIREALDAAIQTQRTLQSGLYYEAQPANVLAGRIAHDTLEGIEQHRKVEREKLGMTQTRDSDVLTILVFFQRLAIDRNNGRPKGRAFIDYLRDLMEDAADIMPDSSPASSLIVP